MASSRAILLPIAVLILRLLTLGLLVASLAVIASDKLSVDLLQASQKYTFRDFYAYRYLLAAAVIGCAYTLLQLPFAAISIARGKKQATAAAGGGGGRVAVALALVLVLADVVFALLLATGAAAGFGFTNDAKHNLDQLFDDYDELQRDMDRFFELANASAGLILGAAACMTLVIMISVYSIAS